MGLSDNRIPEDKLPACWSDDVRMNALFAPFRLKSANPESWEMRIKFWTDMLREWCRSKDDPIVSAADAKVAFQRKGRTPVCLEIVVEEAYRSGILSPITKYQQILNSGAEGWLGWGARLAFKPAVLAVSAVGYLLPKKQLLDNDGLPKASIDATQRFVLESAVQEQAYNLIQNYPAGVERVGTVDELMVNCGKSPEKREAFEILLGYLVSQGLAVRKGDFIKLAQPSSKVQPITESDEALVRLITAERKLSADAERLASEAERAATEAKAALQMGNRLAAKNHLRRKHKLCERAIKCESSLENVRSLLQSMREMEINLTTLHTYKSSTEAMKKGMKDGGLSEESVHDTMDDLKDVLNEYSEVERALSGNMDDVDQSELEAELAELMANTGGSGGTNVEENKKEGERKPQLDAPLNLPSPPKSKPRHNTERDFVFDGEARMLAELAGLSEQDVRARGTAIRASETHDVRGNQAWAKGKASGPESPQSRGWYRPRDQTMIEQSSVLDRSLDELCSEFREVRTDDRLHPGQKLDVDYTKPAALYNADFQVQDHSNKEGVWLFSPESRPHPLAASTDHITSESPGKHISSFQMAPGGERRPHEGPWRQDSTDDLQKRLDQLRRLS